MHGTEISNPQPNPERGDVRVFRYNSIFNKPTLVGKLQLKKGLTHVSQPRPLTLPLPFLVLYSFEIISAFGIF